MTFVTESGGNLWISGQIHCGKWFYLKNVPAQTCPVELDELCKCSMGRSVCCDICGAWALEMWLILMRNWILSSDNLMKSSGSSHLIEQTVLNYWINFVISIYQSELYFKAYDNFQSSWNIYLLFLVHQIITPYRQKWVVSCSRLYL